jgi:hypothetical protein
MKVRSLIGLVLISVFALPIAGTYAQRERDKTVPAVAHGNADYITANQLKDYLSFIAADEMEGRGTPSRGLDITAKFISTHLSRWGLRPGGDEGTYFQRIALRRTKIDPLQTHAELNGQKFSYGDDFLANVFPGTFAGPIVYVGKGWVIKSKGVDDYRGLEIKDKLVVLVEGGLPKGVSRQDLTGKQGEDWDSPLNSLRKRGAKAILPIPNFGTLVDWQQRRQDMAEEGVVQVEQGQNQSTPPLPVIRPSLQMCHALFQGEKQTAAVIFNRAAAGDPVASFELSANKQLSVTVSLKSAPATTQNIIAVLEGSEPVLKNEYVALSAHYDHLGIGTPVNGDAIYNGADDDGSGTAAVLALAEAFARGSRPKRSILFIWHCGEERFLWGSRYFTEHPTVPLNQIIANLNIDMIGRTRKEADANPANKMLVKPGEIYVIGSKKMSTELGEISEAVNQSYLRLRFNYQFDDPQDTSQLFSRSDHISYARKGIPIIFYYAGEHEDYHQPSDSVDKIDYQNMEKVARTVYATAWELANRAQRPRVDKPL